MAGRGRGRGRGAMLAQKEPIPGGGGDSTPDPIAPLRAIIKSMSVEGEEQEILMATETAKRIGTSRERFDQIVTAIYDRCYEEWQFAKCAATICHKLESLQAEDTKFRAIVLKHIQTDYKVKEELRGSSPKKFVGCVSFLCQVFSTMRSSDGEPFSPLVSPVFEVLEMCLDKNASNEETTCGATQIFTVGKLLQSLADKTKVNQLKNHVRDKVLDGVGSRDIRLLLIDVVEGFASNWKLHCDS